MSHTTSPGTAVDDGRSPAASTDPAASPDPLWRSGSLYAFKVFVGVHGALFLLGLLATALLQQNAPANVPGWAAPPATGGWHNLFTAWERWDALWFLKIASAGYADGDLSAAFFPLFPLLVRAVSFVLGSHPLAAGLLVSNAAAYASLVVFYALTAIEKGAEAARRCVLYLAVFPTAYFFVAPYSESLFLLLVVSCFFCARRGRWVSAVGLGALAAATRSIGIVLALPLAVEAWVQFRESAAVLRTTLVLRIVASGGVALGTVAYMVYWWQTNGDFLTPVNDQHGWLREFAFPWQSLVSGTRTAFDFIGSYPGGYHLLDWLFVVFAAAATIWVVKNERPSYAAFTLLAVLMPLFFVFGGRPFMSFPRFVLPVFPLFWAVERFGKRFRAHDVVVATFSAGLGVMTLLFVSWYYVF